MQAALTHNENSVRACSGLLRTYTACVRRDAIYIYAHSVASPSNSLHIRRRGARSSRSSHDKRTSDGVETVLIKVAMAAAERQRLCSESAAHLLPRRASGAHIYKTKGQGPGLVNVPLGRVQKRQVFNVHTPVLSQGTFTAHRSDSSATRTVSHARPITRSDATLP